MAKSAERRTPEHLYAKQPRSAAGAAAIESLQALSESVHDADEQALRSLRMRSIDALALLHLVQAERDGQAVSPTRLAGVLKLSSAAITKLIDRLVEGGRVRRSPNPKDRRGVAVAPTASAVEDVARAYAHIHAPLVDVIDELTDSEAEVVGRFASRLADALRRAEERAAAGPDGEDGGAADGHVADGHETAGAPEAR